jgi:poly(A) polymerase
MPSILHTLPVPAWVVDIIQQLEAFREGAEVRVIGGWVRDQYRGVAADELDLATTLLPEEVIATFATTPKIKVLPTGIRFGTVMIVTQAGTAEITTLRQDIDCDGRHATVQFSTDWQADAMRRDFTINALSYSLDGQLHDYTTGLADVAAQKVRFIGQAQERIREDRLRILRYFRFASLFDAPIIEEDAEACFEAIASLQHLSVERIQMELNKWLLRPIPPAILRHPACTSVLEHCLGGTIHSARYLDFAPWLHVIAPSLQVLCSLWMLKDDLRIEKTLRHLRFSNAMLRHSRILAKLLPRLQTKTSLRKLAEEIILAEEREFGICAMVIGHVLQNTTSQITQDLDALNAWIPPIFPLNGDDLLAAGIPAGPNIKTALETAKRAWIDSGYMMDKQALLRHVV